MTKKWRLRDVDKLFIKIKIFQKNVITFINIYKTKIRIRNDVAREHVFIQIFYIFSKVFQNVIVKLLWMMKVNFSVDWIILTWRFKINSAKIIIWFFKNSFDFDNKIFIYTLMCSTFDVEITLKMHKLFELLKNYENCFNLKNAKTFFEHENKNYVIDLILVVKSSYKSLYIFSEIAFNISKDYLLKNLILNYIREFTNCTSASIFFIFKKNIIFCFYIDYKELNTFIIKNKCSFSLIDKMLNRLVNAIYFNKFDFKNAYYLIKICKSDEWMTTFHTRYNHFEYTIISFELVNVSVTF